MCFKGSSSFYKMFGIRHKVYDNLFTLTVGYDEKFLFRCNLCSSLFFLHCIYIYFIINNMTIYKSVKYNIYQTCRL